MRNRRSGRALEFVIPGYAPRFNRAVGQTYQFMKIQVEETQGRISVTAIRLLL
jgi:hypothetical protein